MNFDPQKSARNVDEAQFLSGYDITSYDRPSVATDIAVFSLFEEDSRNHRKNATAKLHLLLIKRGEHPFMNCWALPGGFLRSQETIEDCAIREVKEETNLAVESLLQVGVFSDPGRDPRGRILSIGYASVIHEKAVVMSGGDAIHADWFAVEYQYDGEVFTLQLSNGDTELSAELRRKKTLSGTEFETVSCKGIAFDHAQIVAAAILAMRKELENGEIAFRFLPERFTLAALQRVHEILGGSALLTANFRRKIADQVEETELFTEGAGHRPARLYKRKA